VNQLDENAKESFKSGRPLEDSVDLTTCKHCKKSVLKTAAKAHVSNCLKVKREKLQRKKELKEQRDRERREGAQGSKDEDGDTRMEDDESDEASKGVGGIKSAKKSAGKKVDSELGKGKKRKADGDAEKGIFTVSSHASCHTLNIQALL
jgi:SAGA-associated factor 73